MREEVELIRETTTPFDLDAFLAGKQTPVFFGSAISNFGIQNLLDGFRRAFTRHKSNRIGDFDLLARGYL
jgi:peptide subunit release factor RF-3